MAVNKNNEKDYLKDIAHKLDMWLHLEVKRHGTGITFNDLSKLAHEGEANVLKLAEDLKVKEEELRVRELNVNRLEQVLNLKDLANKIRALRSAGQDDKPLREKLKEALERADEYVKDTAEYKEAYNV